MAVLSRNGNKCVDKEVLFPKENKMKCMRHKFGLANTRVAVAFFLLIFLHAGSASDFQCDFNDDSCLWQNDGVCDDNSVNPESPVFASCNNGGDCIDCDPCGAFHYTSCETCVDNGCVWCPGNGFCSSEALSQDYFDGYGEGAMNVACETNGDWISDSTTCTANADASNNLFSDPLYDSMQWTFDPEFSDKFSIEGSCLDYANSAVENDHGTATASIATAAANNGECSAGIAPNAVLSSCNLLENDQAAHLHTYALTETALDHVDISSNSWGEYTCVAKSSSHRRRLRRLQDDQCPFMTEDDVGRAESPCYTCNFGNANPFTAECVTAIRKYCQRHFLEEEAACTECLTVFSECEYSELSHADEIALQEGVTSGRNGLGIIYVFASGNELHLGADVNFDGWLNSRYTISVAAVDRNGKHSDYSTGGAPLFCSAPGGDSEFLTNNIVAKPGGGCQNKNKGTSFSCPAASGVIALILEVNPSLGWRDVQGILALTSQMILEEGEVIDDESSSWTMNAASFHHSYLYGFGIIDAAAAVDAARTWENYGIEESLTATSGTVNLLIVDDPSEAVDSVAQVAWSPSASQEGESFITETVVVRVVLEHPSRGDLDIRLTSPQGTESILHPGKRPESAPLKEEWKLSTVRAWGEDPVGDWTLSITDQRTGDLVNGCIDRPYSLPVGSIDLTCDLIVLNNMCAVGSPYLAALQSYPDRSGNTAGVACCACGGGLDVSEIQDILVSWDITVYGHVGVVETPSPSPQPTQMPQNSYVTGDPHFKTWSGELYDFHGICDLNLLKNPLFGNGVGMDIHVRARKMKQFSYISTAAIRIGDDSLEVAGEAGGDTFWLNGKRGPSSGVLEYGASIGGYKISFRRVNSQHREYKISISNTEEIVFQTWKKFVRVDVIGARSKNFHGSLGLMGSFDRNGTKLGRDGVTVFDDVNKFGLDWQVLASETKLFRKDDGPQHPDACEIPTQSALRRRLAESTISLEEAELACSRANNEERDLCVYDVMATNDKEVAAAY